MSKLKDSPPVAKALLSLIASDPMTARWQENPHGCPGSGGRAARDERIGSGEVRYRPVRIVHVQTVHVHEEQNVCREVWLRHISCSPQFRGGRFVEIPHFQYFQWPIRTLNS